LRRQIRSQFAGLVKADVRCPIRIEARDCKNSAVAVLCITGNNDFPITLDSDTVGVVALPKSAIALPVALKLRSSFPSRS